MQRREFSGLVLAATATTAGTLLPGLAAAQGAPVEGKHYQKLASPAPVAAPTGKIEVVEFFWYGCPHCNVLEPVVEAWSSKLPPDVVFRRVPVAFRAEPYEAHQRIYYAIEAMGLVGSLHPKVFQAIHVEKQRLAKPDEIAAFVAKNGVDSKRFMELYQSFGVTTKLKQAQQLTAAYRIEGVPTIGVHGRFLTSGSLAGPGDAPLKVADHLVGRIRQGG